MVVHQYDRACAAFLHAIEVGGRDLRSQLEFCRALVKLHKFEEARQTAAAALMTIPADVSDWEVQSACADFHDLDRGRARGRRRCCSRSVQLIAREQRFLPNKLKHKRNEYNEKKYSQISQSLFRLCRRILKTLSK
jgi:hypothetical protein